MTVKCWSVKSLLEERAEELAIAARLSELPAEVLAVKTINLASQAALSVDLALLTMALDAIDRTRRAGAERHRREVEDGERAEASSGFVELTVNDSGEAVWVRADTISIIESRGDSGGTWLYVTGQTGSLIVREEADEIRKRIGGA